MKKRVMSFLLVLAICGLSIFSLASVSGNASTEIDYWFGWGGSWGKMHSSVVDVFNIMHPEIKVNALSTEWEEIRTKLALAIAGGNPPDVVTIFGSTDAGRYPDMYVCVDEFIEKDKELMGSQNWFPSVLENLKFEDKLYGFPFGSTSEGLYCNVDLFKEAGLDPQNLPKYWSDLQAAAEKLTKTDERGEITTLGFWFSEETYGAFDVNWTPYWSYRNNGRWWDAEKRKMTCTDPKNIETWEWLASWAKKYGPEKMNRWLTSCKAVGESGLEWFAREKVAMEENGGYAVGAFAYYAPELNYDVTMVPYPKGGRPVTTNYCDCVYIPKGTEHPQEAWTFLKWMVSSGAAIWAPYYGETPARYDIAAAPGYKGLPHYDLLQKVNIDYHKYGETALPGFPIKTIFEEEADRRFEEVMFLKRSPEDALEELQTVMQRELDEFYEKK